MTPTQPSSDAAEVEPGEIVQTESGDVVVGAPTAIVTAEAATLGGDE